MPSQSAVGAPIEGIVVRIQLGDSLMAASDDPLFLGLEGAAGREFRLLLARGKSLRRGAEEVYVLGSPGGSAATVAHAEFNDPTEPALDLDGVTGIYVRKGFDPVPNVRAVGEMDDRVEIADIEVTLHAPGHPTPRRFRREGPFWLGLISGLRLQLAPLDGTT